MQECHAFVYRDRTKDLKPFSHGLTSIARQTGSRLALRIEDPSPDSAHTTATAAADRSPDAILTWPTLQLPSAEAIAEIRPLIDNNRSRVFWGERHDIVPGSGTILLSFMLYRITSLNRAGFQLYWLHHHADHGRRTLMPPNTYSQIHAVDGGGLPRLKSLLPNASADEHDGIAECQFPDLAAFQRQMARADVSVDALEDERRFIDHPRSTFGVFTLA